MCTRKVCQSVFSQSHPVPGGPPTRQRRVGHGQDAVDRVGTLSRDTPLVEMRDLSQSKWRYVYLLLMVDRKRDAVKLVYRALWPENEWLRARYGRSGWPLRARLRHMFDAARGRI